VILFTASIVLFLLVTPSSAAPDGLEAIAWLAESPIAIDGDLGEWNRSSPLVLNDRAQLIKDGDYWAGPSDLSARVYVMWDDSNLYIGADVTEDTPFGAIDMLPIANNDNITLYLSTNPEADPLRTSYQSTDFRVILVIDNLHFDNAIDRSMVADRQGFLSLGMDGGESVLRGYERAARQTTTGYTFEAKIPWSNFSNTNIPLFRPEVGARIGFDIAITDISYPCPGTEFIPVMAWTGDASLVRNPSVWGVLRFEAAPSKQP